MKTKYFFSPIVLCVACSLLFAAGGVSHVSAASAQPQATAKKQPVAQKAPAAKPKPKAKTKVAPRQDASHLTKIDQSSPKKAAPAKQAAKKQSAPAAQSKHPVAATDKVKNSLDTFAKDCIVRMNRQRRPGISHKEVKRQPDGTYMARYMAVDPDTLETSYNPTENNKTIKFIGRMDYHEIEYVSIGKDQKQALAGPFNETNRTPITELIKFKSGKWTY